MTLRERVARIICKAMDDHWEREGSCGLMEAYGPIADKVIAEVERAIAATFE